eukprot:1044043-Alexandrium_andersonii.AAC.2
MDAARPLWYRPNGAADPDGLLRALPTHRDVIAAIRARPARKACGEDGIPQDVWKVAPRAAARLLHPLMI